MWTNLKYIETSRMNVARIFLQPFRFSDGSAFPGSSLGDRLIASLQEWNGLVDWCLSKNIYVMFALSLQIGYPKTSSWPDDGRHLWTDAAAQDELVAAWVALARRYAGRLGLVFDLFNEPHGLTASEVAGDHAVPKAAWNAIYPRIIAAIRAVDPERWIVVEPIWAGTAYLADLTYVPDNRTLYSFHCYSPHYFTHQGVAGWPAADSVPYPGTTQEGASSPAKPWNKDAIASLMEVAVAFRKAHGARIMLGETGCARSAPDADRGRWFTDVYALANERNFDTVFFMYDAWNPPASFRLGWGFENTSAEPVVLSEFAKN